MKKKTFTGTPAAVEEYLKENYPNFSHLTYPRYGYGNTSRAYWKCHGEQNTRWVGVKKVKVLNAIPGNPVGVIREYRIDLDKADKAEAASAAEKVELDEYFAEHRARLARLAERQPFLDNVKDKVRELNQELNVQGNHTVDIIANVQVTEDAKQNATYHVDYIISHKSLVTCNVSHFQEALGEFLTDYAKWGNQKPR